LYVLLNGSFGVGKSHVARALCRALPNALIADPEWIGYLLQRVAQRHRLDFQHDPLWRRLTVAWARTRGRFAATIIVPMAFTDLNYLEEVRTGLAADGRPVVHFCLTAPLAVIRERLEARGEPAHQARWAWVHRRAAECCDAHSAPAFAEHVSTLDRSPAAVAELLAARLIKPNDGARYM
jgi:predicted kinase